MLFLCALRALTWCTFAADVTRLNVQMRRGPRPECGAHVGLSIAMQQGRALQAVPSTGAQHLEEGNRALEAGRDADDDKTLRRQALAKRAKQLDSHNPYAAEYQ